MTAWGAGLRESVATTQALQGPVVDRRVNVVHIAGRMTDEVYSLVGPLTRLLASSGYSQAIVIFDEARYRSTLLQLDESIEFFLVPRARNPLKGLRDLTAAAREALARSDVQTLHLHGITSCVIGGWAARQVGGSFRVVYSPHASRVLGWLRGLAALVYMVLPRSMKPSNSTALVNLSAEKSPLSNFKSVDLIESPIEPELFAARRSEARRPLIVSRGNHDCVRAAERFAQIAVLLSGEPLGLSFNWIGAVDEISHQRLNAANVSVFGVRTTVAVAEKLAAGWIYVATGGEGGYPIHLVEAMACGLPCVAIDQSHHRALIDDGQTGFLCATEAEMMERIAVLIDNPALRVRIGANAREATRSRFSSSDFNERVLRHYAPSTSAGL